MSDLARKVNNLLIAKQQGADADKMIAEGSRIEAKSKHLEAEGKRLEAEGKAEEEQAKAKIALAKANTIKGLEGMVTAVEKMQGVFKATPGAAEKIEAIRRKILQLKDNLPEQPMEQQRQMQALKQDYMLLVQSLQKK